MLRGKRDVGMEMPASLPVIGVHFCGLSTMNTEMPLKLLQSSATDTRLFHMLAHPDAQAPFGVSRGCTIPAIPLLRKLKVRAVAGVQVFDT